jgi:amino acid transporter
MVGIGPFVAIPFIMGALPGSACLLAWLLGAVLAFADGAVWAELGAKWPEAGGSYIFLQQLFGQQKWGRLMAFLYTWQTLIQAPLVIASGAIGFALYLNYLLPVNWWEQKCISGLIVILVTLLLYRKISGIGKISVVFAIITCVTLIWIIAAGFTHFNAVLAFHSSPHILQSPSSWWRNMGSAGTKAIYCYLGYYNVCNLGGEIKEPQRNLPGSIFISILIIASLYLLMQIAVMGVVPDSEAASSSFIISLFFEKIYGPIFAQVATVMILLIAISSLFSVMLGYSRVPYAAAIDGNFFSVFGKIHPAKKFPHVSLLFIAGLAFVFSLLFKMQQVITAIIIMRILVQFIAQGVGLIAYHRQHKNEVFPFRMWLYPLPALIAMGIWLFIFFSASNAYVLYAFGIILSGLILYAAKSLFNTS